MKFLSKISKTVVKGISGSHSPAVFIKSGAAEIIIFVVRMRADYAERLR